MKHQLASGGRYGLPLRANQDTDPAAKKDVESANQSARNDPIITGPNEHRITSCTDCAGDSIAVFT